MLLMGSAFIAIGIFISSLTENTIIAAVFAFMANVMISMVDSVASTVSWEPVRSLLNMISFQTKYRNFALGLISLSDVVFFVSIALLFLFFTDRITDRRRWA